jgi:hypothetical protein
MEYVYLLLHPLVCSEFVLALSVATYYILTQSTIHSKLVKELRTAVTDPENLPSWAILERLPYLISLSPASTSHPFSDD